MLQTVDEVAARRERAEWMRLLSCAPLDLLEECVGRLPAPHYTWLRRPEAGLVMVEGRVGGEGARFNLGEMTVTRCALRLDSGQTGVAYVKGRSSRHAELAAIADALMQAESGRAGVESIVLRRLREEREKRMADDRRRARATRVEFFTVARGEG